MLKAVPKVFESYANVVTSLDSNQRLISLQNKEIENLIDISSNAGMKGDKRKQSVFDNADQIKQLVDNKVKKEMPKLSEIFQLEHMSLNKLERLESQPSPRKSPQRQRNNDSPSRRPNSSPERLRKTKLAKRKEM